MDERLKAKNLKLISCSFVMPDFELVPTMQTAWIDKTKAPPGQKSKPPPVFVGYCPFCGKSVTPETKHNQAPE